MAPPDPPHAGLTGAEARARLARDGPNALPVSAPRSVLRLLREVVSEPMFLLLVACGAIYMALGDRQEAMMLLGFVGVVMAITFVQQRRSERSLEALRDRRPRAAGRGRPASLLAGVGAAGLGLLWFEAVKWTLRQRPPRAACGA